MYVASSELDLNILYQGDVLKDFPFIIIEDKFVVAKKNGEEITVTEDGVETLKEAESLLLVKAKHTKVMLLSQSCDIQQRENIIVAPIYPLKFVEENKILSKEKVAALRRRKMGYWFYLPKLDTVLEESFVDFQTMFYISPKILESYKINKIITVSDWGRHHLGWALSSYFGRPVEDK